MNRRTKILLTGAAVLALGAGGTGVALATGDDDANDRPITGTALGRASQAALDHVGAGEVTETEVGDEESYYEVEVRLPGGGEVDVQLDRGFDVVGEETDSETEDGDAD